MRKIIFLTLILSTLFLSWCFNKKIDTENITDLSVNTQSWSSLTGSVVWNEVLTCTWIDSLNLTWANCSGTINSELNKKWEGAKNLTIKSWKYCLLEVCIPENITVTQSWGFYLWIYENTDKNLEFKKYTYKLSKNKDYLEVVLEETMASTTIKIFKIWDVYIKSIEESWCGGTNLYQNIYNEKWQELVNYVLPDIKKTIFIWNIMYKQSLSWTWWFWQPLDSYNKFKVYFDNNRNYKVYNNEDEFKTFIENQVYNVDKKLYSSYIVHFKNHPWINIMYNSVWFDNNSFRVVYLWDDINYISKNIGLNWEFNDLAISNKIISYYSWKNADSWIFDKDGKRIENITSKDLPFFTVKKLNNSWNYLVYMKSWYQLQTFAEMCKPVVYYYSTKNENNVLKLDLKKWDYFTKLIPNLDKNSSWNFKSSNWKIIVDNKSYDYLYYSLITIWYKSNQDWWIVSWNNILEFFNDKLDKINFNANEKKDFIDFWINEYSSDKYYFVSFKYKDEMDKVIPLNFSKKVNNVFRVLLDSYEIDYLDSNYKKYLYDIKDKNKFDKYIIQRFNRWIDSTEVFEWGWVLRKSSETIIK